MTKNLYRQLESTRHTPRAALVSKATPAPRSGFDDLLVKLGIAAGKLHQARRPHH